MKFISSLFKTFYYFLECALERLNSIPKGLKNVTITLCIILIFLPSNTIIFLNSDVNFNLLFTITNLVENSPFVYNILNNLLLSHTNSLLELELWDEKTLHLIHNVFVYTITSEGFLDWLKDVNMFELKNNKFFENLFLTTFNLDFLDYENIYFLTEGGLYWDIFTTNFNFFAIKTRIINEIFFINFFSIFLKKKIILFMFFNVILILSMAYNLYKLYDSTNLIYALLHFLYFAVLSGLLILLWGSTYLAFCIILIYGAAIPVLALYIIMLVNVDLIQRLFFFEHLNKEKVTEKYKGMLVLIFFIFYCCFCFKWIDTELLVLELPWLQEIYQVTVYFSLMKWQFDLNLFASTHSSIFDLVLSFYSSDLDKVASAAFHTSYNELLALVFLLLIAIIVAISISRPNYSTHKNTFKPVLDEKHFLWGYVFYLFINRQLFIENLEKIVSFRTKKLIFWTKINSLTHPTYQNNFMSLPIDYIQPHSIDTESNFDKFATIMAYTTDFKVRDYWTQWHAIYDYEVLVSYMRGDDEGFFYYDAHIGHNIPVDYTPYNFSNKMLF